MNDVLNLAFRVPVEILWPGGFSNTHGDRSTSGSKKQSRPETYGEAYESLLRERDLLALGIHRPPVRIGGSNSNRAGEAAFSRCPGGSRYLAITCPSSSFPLRDGDCLFVLRPPSDAGATVDPGAGEGEAGGLSPEQRMKQLPDGDEVLTDALTSATPETASTRKFKEPLSSTVPAASLGNSVGFAVTLEEEEKGASADPKEDTSWKLNSDLEATRPVERSGRPLTTGVDGARDSETIATAQTKDSVVEWALGLLARTSPHRVDCSELSEGGDTAWVDGGQPLLHQRVLDAVERVVAAHSVSRSASLIVEDETESFGGDSGRDGHKEGVSVSLPPVDIGTDKKLASRGGRKAAAVRPEKLMCSGCNQVLGYWGEASSRGPLALGCGHVTCLDCLENSSLPLTSTGMSRSLWSSGWWCPSCGAAASAVLPLV